MKKIVTIAHVKNEADIIESYCRYNSTFCDRMLIYENNRSSDDTRTILLKLIEEGLPITLIDGEDIDIDIAKDKLARIAVETYGADVVIPLDADEFLYHVDGINPKETLEGLREDTEYRVNWRTYIYNNEPDIEKGFMPNNFFEYRNPELEEAGGHAGKTLTTRYLVKDMESFYPPGAHWLIIPEELREKVPIIYSDELVVAHFPVRSQFQVITKTISTWINVWKAPIRPTREVYQRHQIGMLFEDIINCGEVSKRKIRQSAIEYSLFNMGDGINIAKLILSLGDEIVIQGRMNVSFCEQELALKYTAYNQTQNDVFKAISKSIQGAMYNLVSEIDSQSTTIENYRKDNIELLDENNKLATDVKTVTTQVQHCQQELDLRNSEINHLKDSNSTLSSDIDFLHIVNEDLEQQINAIYNSNTWKAGKFVKRYLGIFKRNKS